MTTQLRFSPRFVAACGVAAMSFVLLNSHATADTLAYWRFEGDGVTSPADGDFVRDTNGRTTVTTDGILAIDSSGNGNHLYTWDNNTTGHQYRPFVNPNSALVSGDPNNFSIQNNGDFPASFTWSAQSNPTVDVEPIVPSQWTIEASIYKTANTFHQTFVGRDGNDVAGDANLAPLYFKTIDGNLQILYTDAAGNTWDAMDPDDIALNTWYNVAAVSDGTTLSLYKDAGAGYQLVASTDVSTSANSALAYDTNGSTTAGDTQWGWTVGRGRYGGSDAQFDNHVDRWLGYIDEVRISNTALTPSQFLFEPDFALVLDVNTTNGNISIRNVSGEPVSMNYYIIESNDGAGSGLDDANWNSLDEQNIDAGLSANFNGAGGVDGADLAQWEGDFGLNGDSDSDGDGDSDGADFMDWQRQVGKSPGPGDGWTEAGASGSNQLAELYLNGDTTLAPGESLSIGSAYNQGLDPRDLSFEYGVPGGGALLAGGVLYDPPAAVGATAAVPEPTTVSMICLVAVGALAVRRYV